MPLIAYNINLDTSDLEIANKIARAIRAAGGGFKYCKAIGVMLEERNVAQVSMSSPAGRPLPRWPPDCPPW